MNSKEKEISKQIEIIRSRFNRKNYNGKLFVSINGKSALFDPWFGTFYKWVNCAGWIQINPVYYFLH